MKKRMSKVLSGLIILTMIISSTGLAFADKCNTQSDSEIKTDIQIIKNSESMSVKGEASNENTEMPEINISDGGKNLISKSSGLEKGFAGKAMYKADYSLPAYNEYSIETGGVSYLPVTAGCTGIMYFDYRVFGNTGDKVRFSLGYEKDGKLYQYTDSFIDVSAGSVKSNAIYLPVNNKEIVYLIIEAYSSNKSVVTASSRAKVYTTGTRTLAQGDKYYTLVSGINYNSEGNGVESVTWFKITPKTTGRLSVALKEYGDPDGSDANVTLYSKDNKSLSNAIYYYSENSNARAYFGVKAGVTYYLKVTGCCGYDAANNFKYGICYNVTAKTDRAIGTTKYAQKLVRGAASTNSLFVADGKNSTDYYKFYVPSKRVTQFKVDTSGIKSSYVYITVYYKTKSGAYKKIGSTSINNKYNQKESNGNTYIVINSTSRNMANAGWYYVKVTKGTMASGSYSIKYVK